MNPSPMTKEMEAAALAAAMGARKPTPYGLSAAQERAAAAAAAFAGAINEGSASFVGVQVGGILEAPSVAAPPRATRTKKRTEVMAEHGAPRDSIAAAKGRVRHERRQKAKFPVKTHRTLGLALSSPVAEAVELISDEYDVPVSAVLRRMVEDGVRRYASPEILRHSGLALEKKKNPFDPMDTQATSPLYDAYQQKHNAPEPVPATWGGNAPDRTLPAAVAPPMIFRGAPLPSDPTQYGEPAGSGDDE